jgi:hypothetical protein
MNTPNEKEREKRMSESLYRGLHFHCDRDITRLGRENDELRAENAALKAGQPRADGKPRMTLAQRNRLWDLCAGYNVPFREDDYYRYPDDSSMMPGWVQGWVGGRDDGSGITGRRTIEVGVSPEGESHS